MQTYYFKKHPSIGIVRDMHMAYLPYSYWQTIRTWLLSLSTTVLLTTSPLVALVLTVTIRTPPTFSTAKDATTDVHRAPLS